MVLVTLWMDFAYPHKYIFIKSTWLISRAKTNNAIKISTTVKIIIIVYIIVPKENSLPLENPSKPLP